MLLGYEQAIRSVARGENAAREWSRDLIKSGSPTAIEVLIPYVFKNEPLVNTMAEDVYVISNSHWFATHPIPLILAKNPVFSPAVADWAGKVMSGAGFTDSSAKLEWCRATIRSWWKDNEHFFRKKEYGSVQPPKSPP